MGSLTLSQGLRLLAQRQFKDLHEQAIDAIKSNIENAVPYFFLGTIALEHGNFTKAIELFSKAEHLAPKTAIYPAYKAKALSALRRPNEAKLAADTAASLTITDHHIFDLLGVVYSRTGYHENAIPMFEQAVSLNEGEPNYFYNLGASSQFTGDFEKAKQAYEFCLALDPDFWRAWASLVALNKQTSSANVVSTLKALFDKFEGDEDAVQQLGHAIAKSLEDMGQHEDSFDWLLKAKANKRLEYKYDQDAGLATFAAAKRTSENMTIYDNPHTMTPIFIVGLPRTGTTLVDRILSSHSQVISAGEMNVFAELVKAESKTDSHMVLDAVTFEAAKHIDLSKIGQSYAEKTKDRARDMAFMIDKMPLNFFYAGLIHQALPNARIIALRRGAMDSCLSNFRQLLSVKESFYNYTFDIEDTAFFYQQFDELMTHWRDTLPSERFMEIHYEDIVFDQENQTRRLLNFCSLEFEEACLRFHENMAPVSTASSVQVRQPLYSGSIGRWRKYGNKLNGLRNALGDLAN